MLIQPDILRNCVIKKQKNKTESQTVKAFYAIVSAKHAAFDM